MEREPLTKLRVLAYVASFRHRLPDGTIKTLRAMGEDLGYSHPTVKKWLIRFGFVDVVAECAKAYPARGGYRTPPRRMPVPRTWNVT
jgi:hypothetical protein